MVPGRAAWQRGGSGLRWRVGTATRAERTNKGASGRSIKDSASEAWPSEVRSFLGPTSRLPQSCAPVKGLVGLARELVCSRDARSPFDPPTPKPDTVAPSAEPRLGDGGDDEPAGTISRPPRVGRNVRPRASGIAVAVPRVVRQQQSTPRHRSPRHRTPRADVRPPCASSRATARRSLGSRTPRADVRPPCARASASPPPRFFLLRSSRLR